MLNLYRIGRKGFLGSAVRRPGGGRSYATHSTPGGEAMSEKISQAKAERMQSTIEKQRDRLREGARLGQNALITGIGGGFISGWLEAKQPTVPGTSVSSVGAGGILFVLGALSGVFEEYSDQLCALGSGMLACAIQKEATGYFLTT